MGRYAKVSMIVCALMSASALALGAGTVVSLEPQYEQIDLKTDIVYGTVDGVDLLLDVARPAGVEKPLPLIVVIHGGGWQKGHKNGKRNDITFLAQHGYVAASVGYRLAPKYQFPAQVHDVKRAVRFLRAHAQEYGIDRNHVGATGDSAGGHLSLMLGLTDPKDGLEGDGYTDQLSAVGAVVNFYGGVDLREWDLDEHGRALVVEGFGKPFEQVIADFLGTSDRTAAVMAQATPSTYADKDDSPILTFHGDQDPLVPYEQGKEFNEDLKAAGVDVDFVTVEGGQHGWGPPHLISTLQKTLAFFDEHLGPEATKAAPAHP